MQNNRSVPSLRSSFPPFLFLFPHPSTFLLPPPLLWYWRLNIDLMNVLGKGSNTHLCPNSSFVTYGLYIK